MLKLFLTSWLETVFLFKLISYVTDEILDSHKKKLEEIYEEVHYLVCTKMFVFEQAT